MTKDPLSALTRSPCGYGNENPLAFVDPSGMECTTSTQIGPVSIATVMPSVCHQEVVVQGMNVGKDIAGFFFNHPSYVIAPLVALYCIYDSDNCLKTTVAGAGISTSVNVARSRFDPCFVFRPTTLCDLLVTFAAALPGRIFEATAGRFGPELTPTARRILQILLDAPGWGAEAAHSVRSH